jgi:hypothetical protein
MPHYSFRTTSRNQFPRVAHLIKPSFEIYLFLGTVDTKKTPSLEIIFLKTVSYRTISENSCLTNKFISCEMKSAEDKLSQSCRAATRSETL